MAADTDTQKTMTLTDNQNGSSVELQVIDGSVGPDVLDIRKLYGQTGMFTFDPGYGATGSCKSGLTYIDGDQGVLLHRGYPIEALANHSDFLEVAYLLLEGELPNAEQKAEFDNAITRHTMVHEQLSIFYRGFRRDAHPMAIMCGVVGALSAFYHDSTDIQDPTQRMIASRRLIAKSYAENFLHMCFAVPAEDYEINPILASAMDKIFILHADHEQNASTSTVRLAGSSGANPFACIAAGIASLWGPAHGGANEAVLNMLNEIGHKDNIPEYVNRARDRDDPFRLFGFGHRVYKNFDPRAKVLRETCHQVLDDLGVHDPLLELAMELEDMALKDQYFIDKKLYPNVDFYSGIILKAMGFPTSMFTVLFAVARTVGWVAQWNEMITDPMQRIGRPRQLYTGPTERPFVDMSKR